MTSYTITSNSASPVLRIQDLNSHKRFVAWQKALRNPGDEKPTKVPYDPKSSWQWAKADDPSTWGTRQQAELKAQTLPKPYGFGGIGLQLGDLGAGFGRLCGIDLDSCYDSAAWKTDGWAEDILKAFDTYAEISPSGTGIKIFFRIAESDTAAVQAVLGTTYDGKPKYGAMFKRASDQDHPPSIEVYIGNRYFALTDMMLIHSTLELPIIPVETVLDLLTVTGPEFAGSDRRVFSQKDFVLQRDVGDRTATGDQSRSAKAWKITIKRVAAGDDETQVRAAIAAEPDTAAWLREKGDAYGGREWKRTYERAVAKIAAQTDGHEFDVEPAP